MCSTSLALKLNRERKRFNLEDNEHFMSSIDSEEQSQKTEYLVDLFSDEIKKNIDKDIESEIEKNQMSENDEVNLQYDDFDLTEKTEEPDLNKETEDTTTVTTKKKYSINSENSKAFNLIKGQSDCSFKKKYSYLQVLEGQTSKFL